MNDKITVSTFQIFEMVPDAEAARLYLEARLWPKGAVCPFCTKQERITVRKGGFYRCNLCLEDFTVRTGTIFERSHIPLHKWVYAMYLLLTARKGISSVQLSKEISVTQKSAWFMLQRIREACGEHIDKLRGIIEVDETYVGGKERNKHFDKKLNAGRGAVGKVAVFGMRQRDGKTIAMPINPVDAPTVQQEIKENVETDSKVFTDDSRAYLGLKGYKHKTVNHSAKEYVRGQVHTNGIESVWAVLKRGLKGVYHKASPKHISKYVDEFTFRLNEGHVSIPTLDRLESLVKNTKGKRLTYAALKASPGDSGAREF